MSGEGESSSDSFQVKKSGFQWVVKKEVFTGDKDKLNSMRFSFGFDEQTNWYLKLQPRFPLDNDIWVCLTVLLGTRPVDPIHTKFRAGLVTKDGKEMNVKFGDFDSESFDGVDFKKFIKLDSLLAEDNFFNNDKLTIFCDLEVYKSANPESSLVHEQNQLLQSGDFSDFTLAVGVEELKVHRNILSKSPVFRAMFEHDMKEKQNGRVEIEGLDVVGIKGLLEFLYTGRVKKLEELAKKILPAADRYGVQGLKTLCEQQLSYGLQPKNVVEFLEFAELHTATKLKGLVLAFICENSSEIMKEASFQRLNGSDIFMEVVCALSDKAQSGKPLAKRHKLNT